MKDIVQNEEMSGSAWKNLDGSLEAKTVKLGPRKSGTISLADRFSDSTKAVT